MNSLSDGTGVEILANKKIRIYVTDVTKIMQNPDNKVHICSSHHNMGNPHRTTTNIHLTCAVSSVNSVVDLSDLK